MNEYEISACKGFVRMEATLVEIMEVLWYVEQREVEIIIDNYKKKIK